MGKRNAEVVIESRKVPLPGQYKRMAAMIDDKEKRRAFIREMIDACTTYEIMKRKKTKEKNDE